MPAWFCGNPHPFTYPTLPWMLSTDFISHASPRTHHRRLPSATEYAESWKLSGTSSCLGPPGGS